MQEKYIPLAPWEIVNGLSYFLDLNEEEEILKNIWKQYPEYRTLSYKNANAYFDILKKKIKNWNGPFPDYLGEISTKEYMPYEQNIAIYKHLRYLPAISHSHDFFELTCVVEGDCDYEVLGRHLHLVKGDLIIIPPGLAHTIALSQENTLFFNILIRRTAFGASFLRIMEGKDILTYFFRQVFAHESGMCLLFHTGNNPQVGEHMYVMYSEYLHNFRYSNRMLESILTGFFVLLLRYHEKDAVLLSSSNEKINTDIIFIMNYIQNQYATASLESMAEFFNYSTRQMGRIIKKYTGFTFSTLVQNLKLQEAEQLLKSKETSIAEICSKVGYQDITHFYKVFRERNHCTPKEYRQRQSDN